LQSKEEVQKLIKSLNSDPILEILLKNSNLTKAQLETVLIEVLTKNFLKNEVKSEEKTYFRSRGKISRGAFNRTLKQARRNIIRSIYTIFLLGYLKLADSSSLILQSIEISNKLRDYLEMQEKLLKDEDSRLEALNIVRREIEKVLIEYSSSRDV